jgi:predicted dienelactone hydrolase
MRTIIALIFAACFTTTAAGQAETAVGFQHFAITYPLDWRIKAVVSAAPAIGFAFGRDGLVAVRQPLQLWRADDDHVLPYPNYAEAVRRDLPTPPEMHVVPGAGHYDFLSPCSAELAKKVPTICISGPGFDRAAFHQEFNREIVAFFTRTLGNGRSAPSPEDEAAH